MRTIKEEEHLNLYLLLEQRCYGLENVTLEFYMEECCYMTQCWRMTWQFMCPHRARMGDRMLSDLVFLKCKSLTSAFALMAKSLAGLEAQVLGRPWGSSPWLWRPGPWPWPCKLWPWLQVCLTVYHWKVYTFAATLHGVGWYSRRRKDLRLSVCKSGYPVCNEWRNSNLWLSSAVLCCAALRLTRVVDECNASVCSFVVTSDSCPESSYLVLGVGPPEWLLWLWALQWVFITHREWIWSSKHITPSRNRFDITAFQFSSVGLHRRCNLQLRNSI